MQWGLFVPFLLLNGIYAQLSIKNFVPFGTASGDAKMLRQLDAITPPININIRFQFFSKPYDVIRVYSHGLILFGNITYALPHALPGYFPLKNFVCAAPYWADTDITQDPLSDIFYREITDDNTLMQISNMVQNGLPALSVHRMIWAFVVTWFRVPGHQSNPGRNSYQAIITTNGLYSFTLFTYDQLEWSAGAWNGYPQVGFNAGDQVNYFTLTKSFTADIVQIVRDSNVGIPGQFIFVTNGKIGDMQCDSSEGLQSSPFRGSMHGGYPLRLFGLCFEGSSYIVEINGNTIKGCQFTSVHITCTMPMVIEGRLQIKVFTSDKRLVGQTDFLSLMPETNADFILTNHGEINHMPLFVEDRRLTLQFVKNELTRNRLFQMIIYDYTTEYIVANDTFFNLGTKRVDIGLGALNLSALSNLTIEFGSIFPLSGAPRDQAHSLDISFELLPSNTIPQAYPWNGAKKFIVRPFILSFSLEVSYCSAWFLVQSDANTRNMTAHAPECPCRVRDTWDEEQFGFSTDQACHPRKSGKWNCRFHQGARGCYLRKSTRSDVGAHCCYDNNGVLITARNRGSGSLKAHFPDTAKTLSTYRHFYFDILSYISCCGSGTDTRPSCLNYVRHRPSGSCVNLIPIPPTTGRGDPHFSTLDENSYTFNGHGEYTLLSSTDGQYEIQVRLAPLIDESAPIVSGLSKDSATAISAFVIQNEDQPRIQFELFQKLQLLEIRIDEKLLEYSLLVKPDEILTSSLIYSDDHQVIIRQTDVNSISISYGKNAVQFIVYLRSKFDFLDLISIMPSTFKEKRKFQGILGGFEGLAYPNGTNVSIHLNDDKALFSYGESWRTTSSSSLFYYRFQDSHAQYQDLTYRPIFQQDLFQKYVSTIQFLMAGDACRKVAHRQECMYDVLITNDATIAQMHENYETTLEEFNEYIELVAMDIEKATTIGPEKTTTVGLEKTTTVGLEKTTTVGLEKTTTVGQEITTTVHKEESTTIVAEKTTTMDMEKTSTAVVDPSATTSKLQSAAVKFVSNVVWKFALLALFFLRR